MTTTPTILCPVDFSDASRGAVRYAAAIAEHFRAKVALLAVEDPLLTEALDLGTGFVWDPETTRNELRKFAAKVFGPEPPAGLQVEFQVAVGKPAHEILRVSKVAAADLIVMSTHGLTGMRKLFFGSTTERVLRETSVPVLATPPADPGPITLADVRGLLHRMLVPVDLSKAALHQVQVAGGVSEALNLPLIVLHVIEPVRSPLIAKLHLPTIEHELRMRAEDTLEQILATVPRRLAPESLIAYGDPAEEIAKCARDRQAGLIVIGLHGSPLLGPRMGAVTYRVLCLAPALVLALPPVPPPNDAHADDTVAARDRPVVHR